MGLCCCIPYSFYIPGLSVNSNGVNMPGLSVNSKEIKIFKLSTIIEEKFEVLNDEDEFYGCYI